MAKCPNCNKEGYRFDEKKVKTKDGTEPRKTKTASCKRCGYKGEM